jgi:ABC-type multidrug transport system permease subunit
VLVVIVMSLTGFLVGWRIRSSVVEAIGGFLLLLLFAYAFSWVMAFVGLLAPSPEVVNNAAFVVIFPLTFIANTFVPLSTLPGPLKTFAEWNPISAVTQGAREMFGNVDGPAGSTSWAMQHAEVYTLIWVLVILAVFVPLATRQYKRAASR